MNDLIRKSGYPTNTSRKNRVVGWMYPERKSIKTGVMFYAKTFHQPGLEPSDLESHRCGQSSPLGAAYDEEMRQLVDDSIEMLIRGGD